ncbi:MAG: hypothetical protein U1A72_08885 [Sulfuritalea sp.]|nr:hypothetical protein [Sulfuritalea sp.]
MNPMAKRLEAVETALAKQYGETGYRLVVRADGETDNQARARAGLTDWRGPVIYFSEADANL